MKDKQTKIMGKPIFWTDERKNIAIEKILQHIREGESVNSILKMEGMPVTSTFYKWVMEDENLEKNYARACEFRADFLFEQLLSIADGDHRVKEIEDPDGNKIKVVEDDRTTVSRDALSCDVRKFMIAKLAPKKYGNKIDVTTDGEKINKVTVFELPDNNRE